MRPNHLFTLAYLGRSTLILSWLCIMLGSVGCTTTYQTRGVEHSGFLKNYSQLHPGQGEQAQWVYINPIIDFRQYDKVIIDPITIWREAGSNSLEKVPEEELQQLADYLHQALREQLQEDFTIVEQPGADVLRIRAAISEVKGSKVVLDTLSNVLPPMLVLSTGKRLVTGTHAFVGKAAIEAEVLDSMTGERLMAAVDERVGRKVIRGKFGTWNDVKEAYDFWAMRLKTRLGELRQGK